MNKFVTIVVLLTASIAQAQLATKKILTLEGAKQIAAAAENEAKKNNWSMTICVVDDGGRLMYLERMDGSQLGTVEAAQEKAITAVNFKRPTKVFEDMVAGGRNVILKLSGLPIEGGVPIMMGTELIGAVGVSGGTSQTDGQVATVGSKMAEKMK